MTGCIGLRLIGLVKGRRPPGAVLHSSNEPGELTQRQCHDGSTVNIGIGIAVAAKATPPIATHVSTAWSVCLSSVTFMHPAMDSDAI